MPPGGFIMFHLQQILQESPLDQIETLDLPIGWRCRWISRPPERWSDLSLKDHGGNVQ